MSQQYEFPDDPAVFAQVLEHFRNTNAAHWDARLDRYAREASSEASASVVAIAAENQKIRTVAPPTRPTKRVRSNSLK